MGYFGYSARIPATAGMTSQQALKAAVSQLLEEYGNSVDNPLVTATETLPAMSFAGFTMFVNRTSEELDVEDALIVPVVSDKNIIVKTHKRKIVLTADEVKRIRAHHTRFPRSDGYYDVDNIIPGKLNETFTGVSSITIDSFPAPRKAVATATAGATTTSYVVVNENGKTLVSSSFTTQAAARAAAVELVNAGKADEAIVEARVRRDTGETALVRVTRPEPETATVNVTVVTETAKPNAPVEYFGVFFYYHS